MGPETRTGALDRRPNSKGPATGRGRPERGAPLIRSDSYQAWATPLSSKMNDRPQIGVSSPFAGSGTI